MGACWGSFANVVILRLPRGESVATPRSHCPSCKKMISGFDNIPLVSFLLLKGACRNCGIKISPRYFLVEFLTGALFAAVFWRFQGTYYFYEILLLAWGLVVVSFIDLDHRILPDKFTLPGILIGFAGALLNPERTFLDAFLGFLAGGGFLWAVAYIYFLLRKQEGMGGGDIKLLAWIGTIMGWRSIIFIILASSLFGSLVGLAFGLYRKSGFKTAIPFGPFIAFAAIIYWFAGEAITSAYVQFFFPWLTPN